MGFFSIRCLPSLHIGQTVYYSSLTGVATLPTYKNKMNRSCIFASQENLSATFALLYLMLTLLLIMVVTGNTLFLTAFWRTSSLHTSSNALLAGLATADLGVGLITLPSGIFHLTEIPSRCRSPFGLPSWKVTQRSGSFFTIASILTLAAIAVDRLMAIRLHMRYKEIVTVSRIKIVLASSWLLAVVSVCLIHLHPPTAPVFLFSMFTLLSIIMLYSYINVFVTACHHKRQMQLQASVLQCNQQNAYNTVRYKKSVLTVFYIVGLFLICYLPTAIFIILKRLGVIFTSKKNSSYYLIVDFLAFLVCVSSAVNPLLYYGRNGEIRKAVKNVVKNIFDYRGWKMQICYKINA